MWQSREKDSLSSRTLLWQTSEALFTFLKVFVEDGNLLRWLLLFSHLNIDYTIFKKQKNSMSHAMTKYLNMKSFL